MHTLSPLVGDLQGLRPAKPWVVNAPQHPAKACILLKPSGLMPPLVLHPPDYLKSVRVNTGMNIAPLLHDCNNVVDLINGQHTSAEECLGENMHWTWKTAAYQIL